MSEPRPAAAPRVLLATLAVRTSQRTGREYVTGWLGASRLIGFEGKPDRYGNKTIDLYLTPAEERRGPAVHDREEAPRGPMLTYSRDEP